MAPADWIAAKQFERIREESQRASDIAHGRVQAPIARAGVMA
jgi:hypothetical protein